MHIKSIIIDGFKSYARRTEIHGFDNLFNAITGLNGSGKSNILDSICFLLGITNLSQVRAGSLQELVYKNGQAGITKATVTIIFNNTDKTGSPHGYEHLDEIVVTRQVVVGGRNKYLINGTTVQNVRVQDMFRSVQLNINNPHFLIMQGRITKVLNMKPHEILSMLEEAAGTRLYESKKEIAQKNINKKAAKLDDINRVINEDITPNLKKLQEEKESYMQYQSITRELKILDKIISAYEYYYCNQKFILKKSELSDKKKDLDDIDVTIIKNKEIISELRISYDNLIKEKDSYGTGITKKFEQAFNGLQVQVTKLNCDLEHQNEQLKDLGGQKKFIDKQLNSDNVSAEKSAQQLKSLTDSFEAISAQQQSLEQASELAGEHYNAALSGISTNEDGKADTINNQLIESNKQISTLDVLLVTKSKVLTVNKKKLDEKTLSSKQADGSYKSNKLKYNESKLAFDKLQTELDSIAFEENSEHNLLTERRDVLTEISSLNSQIEKIKSSSNRLQFDYCNPEPNFNRNRVKGVVASLISIRDQLTSTALEVAGGGGLYSIVVDESRTAKLLLENGKLKQRYTIIPLNNIISQEIDQRVVKIAMDLVNNDGTVKTALSLIEFPEEVRAAIKYVFGSVFICKDLNTAQLITYDRRIMRKSVTWAGDSCNPGGTMSGGSRRKTASILVELSRMKSLKSQLAEKHQRLSEIDSELKTVSKLAQRYRNIKQKMSVAMSTMEKAEIVLKNCDFGKHLEQIEELKVAIETLEVELSTAECDLKKWKSKSADMKAEMADAEGTKDREIAIRLSALQEAKKRANTNSTKLQNEKRALETFHLDQKALNSDIETQRDQLKVVEENIEKFCAKISTIEDDLKTSKDKMETASEELKEQKDINKQIEDNISKNTSRCKKLEAEENTYLNKAKELNNLLATLGVKVSDSKSHIDHLLSDNPWICDEKKFFDTAGSNYDFHAQGFCHEENVSKFKNMQETKMKLSKCVNMNAMTMLSKVEEQYSDLLKNREKISKDKSTIMSIINELDIKKNEKLILAHAQVNRDFGSIFSTLLPGTDARLVTTTSEQHGITVLNGLCVKIAFGNIWKESLNELSGGQRSLVALSLILALLLFKPAPLYILDEVDAALDLSHTQNIGQMLRTHFKKSQFIVVSLKDGMFNNANVLFRTRFVEGVSTVTRTTQNHHCAANGSKKAMEYDSAAETKRKRAKKA